MIFIGKKGNKVKPNKGQITEVKKNQIGYGLLVERDGHMSLSKEQINEVVSENGWHCPKPFIIDCVLQKADIKNANGRVYPRNILEREVENYKKRIAEKRALGECDHPSESTISLKNIAHNIIDIWWDRNTVMGKLELNITEGFRKFGIASSAGDQIANMLLNGYQLGISSRAVGSVEEKMGLLVVQNDLELLCWDLVADPSTPGAYLGDEEELQQYVEADMTKKAKQSLNEKINKVKNLLA